MSSPAPGWYADPAGSADFRWWDGAAWTDALSPERDAGPPVAPRRSGPARDRRMLRPAALALALSLLTVVVIGVGSQLVGHGLVGSRVTGSGPGGRVPLTPPDPAGPTSPLVAARTGALSTPGSLNEDTRVASLGSGATKVSLRLPGNPYDLVPQPERIGRSFDVAFVSNALVHPARGHRPLWVSTVALAHVSAPAVGAGTPHTVAGAALSDLLDSFFPAGAVVPDESTVHPCLVTGGAPALTVTARVGYRTPQLSGRYDRLTVVLVALDDGSFVVALSTVPDDAPPEHGSLAAASLATLEVG